MKHIINNLKLVKIILLVFCFGVVALPGLANAQNTSELIVDCALADPSTGDYCYNVDDLLLQAILIAKFLFSIMGVVALLAFVAGGFTMILSFGSAERFKQGKNILVAAVVGIVITFGAYIMIDFILDALQVSSEVSDVGGS